MGDFLYPQVYTKEQVIEASTAYFGGAKLPATVFADKYALRDKDNNFYELTPDDMRRRMAREFARIEQKYPNPMGEQEIYEWLAYIYPQGSPMFGIGNDFVAVSTSNCAVIDGPDDDMSDIFNVARDMANLYKRRFGVGTDLSKLRPEGASVNNAAGSSTGAWSFADFYSFVTRMIGQSGRRGALMLTMDVRHPDIEKFITMKRDLTKVTGANVSVKVSDDFMRAVEADEEFTLRWPVEAPLVDETYVYDSDFDPQFNGPERIVETRVRKAAKVQRTVKARNIFNLIAETATATAEPGFLYWDTAVKNLPLANYPGFAPTSTNPCGEIILSPNDSCRLISIYLPAFVRDPLTSAYFDWAMFDKAVRVAQRLSDDLVDIEIEKLTAIRNVVTSDDERALFDAFIKACEEGRRTGLGTHGLGDTLALLGVKYDSEEGLRSADAIYSTLKVEAYLSSIEMAKERGAFPIFDWETEKNTEFYTRLPERLVAEMAKYGRRNGALLTNAPTGSVTIISMIRDLLGPNGSSGIEPVFSLASYTRNRKIDPAKESTVGATQDTTGDWWVPYTVHHPTVALYKSIYGEESPLPDFFVDSSTIDPTFRVWMQGIITSHIDHSVSSTLNLPKGTKPETVADIYLQAWKVGCKGMTVYVDGSREQQVLSTQATAKAKGPEMDEAKVENRLAAAELRTEVAEAKFNDLLSRFRETEAKLGECGDTCLVPTHRPTRTSGEQMKASFMHPLTMKERKVYVYVGRNDQGQPVEAFVIDQQGDEDLRPYAEALGRMTSLALKFGIPPEKVTEQLKGLKGGSVSYSEGIHQSVPDLLAKEIERNIAYALDLEEFGASEAAPYNDPANASTGGATNGTYTLALGTPLRDLLDKVVIDHEAPIEGAIDINAVVSFQTCPRCEQKTFKVEAGCNQCVNEDCAFAKCG